MNKLLLALVATLAGCVVYQAPPPRVYVPPPPPRVYAPPPAPAVNVVPPDYEPPPPQDVVSVYVDPPLEEPPPIAVSWAPPPMLVESPPEPPYPGAFWIGGYWVWEGNWVWAHGRWADPPRPDYFWVNPYYEHRDGVVVFIGGHWGPPGYVFVPPPPTLNIVVVSAAIGVVPGPRPIGPNGCFVPPPPGSRPGIIVPAPVGTAPAVVTGAPPVVNVGMRIQGGIDSHNTTVVNNVTNITRITNVTIVAPPSATATGQAVNTAVSNQPHLAAGQKALVHVPAPEPVSRQPIAAFTPGRAPITLPPAQTVHPVISPVLRTAHHDRDDGARPVVPARAPGLANPPPAPGAAPTPAVLPHGQRGAADNPNGQNQNNGAAAPGTPGPGNPSGSAGRQNPNAPNPPGPAASTAGGAPRPAYPAGAANAAEAAKAKAGAQARERAKGHEKGEREKGEREKGKEGG